MERRLFTFILASTAFFVIYMSLRVMFGPPPEKVAEDKDAAGEVIEAPTEEDVTDPVAPDSIKPDDADSGDDADAPEIQRPTQESWLTLGSMDPAAGKLMLITLSTLGGGVERIELTERRPDGRLKYRRVDVRHGYLGYFAPTSVDQGVRVNVVGRGTPAELAGILRGDVIVSVAGVPVGDPADVDQALMKTKPDDVVAIEVLRTAAAAADQASDENAAAQPSAPRGPPITLQATVSEHPLDLVRLARDGGDEQVVGNVSRLSCLLTLGQVNGKGIAAGERSIKGLNDPAKLIWNSDPVVDGETETAKFDIEMGAAEMAKIGGKPVRLHRTYSLAKGTYAIDMSVEIENLKENEEPQDLAYRLEGANGITMEGWWYSNKISPNFSGAAARDIVYKTAADGHELISGYNLLKKAKKDPKDPNERIFAADDMEDARNLKYIAVDAQYFTVGYVPPAGGTSLTTFRQAAADVVAVPEDIERHKERAVNCSFFLDSQVGKVPAGQRLRQELRMFAGPKSPEILAQYELGDCVYYGWFSFFSRLLAGALHFFSGVGNYAVAIILLTVLVRAGMFPLSRKAAVNAQRMQELAPELKKIAEQYKDDMEGRLKAQRELQQRVGFNPLAGCLPMFLQLPIFIGLYRALSVDIELRGEPLGSTTGWASNLAGPDMLSYWADWVWEYFSGRGTGWLGPYFNILPVIVVVLFLAQQKMFMPPATDDQTAMTQKMMTVMTMMMGLFFFRVPAGLCIYFITSSLWGICERILVKKTLPSTPHFDSSVIEGSATATKKPNSIAERIRQQVTKPEEPIEPPNKRRRPNGKKKK